MFHHLRLYKNDPIHRGDFMGVFFLREYCFLALLWVYENECPGIYDVGYELYKTIIYYTILHQYYYMPLSHTLGLQHIDTIIPLSTSYRPLSLFSPCSRPIADALCLQSILQAYIPSSRPGMLHASQATPIEGGQRRKGVNLGQIEN